MKVFYVYPLQHSLNIGDVAGASIAPPEIMVVVAETVDEALEKFKKLFLEEDPEFDWDIFRDFFKTAIVQKDENEAFSIPLIRA